MLVLSLLLVVHETLAFERYDLFSTTHQRLKLIPPTDRCAGEVVTKWHIEQPLDHFNATDTRKWNMTYYERMDHFKPGGPVFFMLSYTGLEAAPIKLVASNYLYPFLAKKLNGALVNPEHRYNYNCELNFTNTELEYYTSSQALEDQVRLLKKLKVDPRFKKSMFIAVGPWYAGSLAVWLRQAHPELVDAVYASSPSLLAKFEDREFWPQWSRIIKRLGTPGCYEAISKFYDNLNDCLETPEGRAKLIKEYNICKGNNLNTSMEQNFFLRMVIGLEMSHYEETSVSPADYCRNWWNTTMQKQILQESDDDCHKEYSMNLYIDGLLSPTYDGEFGRFFIYPMCREYGLFRVSTKDQPFGRNLTPDCWQELCLKIYGIDKATLAANIAETNRVYGGLKPNVSRALFVTAEADWNINLTVTEDLSKDAIARVIPKATILADIISGPLDTEEIFEARQFILKTIKSWIVDYNATFYLH